MGTMPESTDSPEPKLRIYFLPNLMTAGNLFCGFLAITRIVEAPLGDKFASAQSYQNIREALFYILLACVFDLLDGRVARMGGLESPFGREFDSLADVVSFGVAPAFLVHRIVLRDLFSDQPSIGWFIASVYLICGALRLARFNCLAAMPSNAASSGDFLGFPIPAAAGMVASLTLFSIKMDEQNPWSGPNWRIFLAGILLFLSFMMVSEVRYPSFKKIHLRTRRPFTKLVTSILVIGIFIMTWRIILPYVLPLMFIGYLLYGFVRPKISRQMRRDIEEEDDEDTADPQA
jgi:CDP-diacylglycerol--serine O-phosphatidyltransferase